QPPVEKVGQIDRAAGHELPVLRCLRRCGDRLERHVDARQRCRFDDLDLVRGRRRLCECVQRNREQECRKDRAPHGGSVYTAPTMLRTGTSAIVLPLGLSACGGRPPQPAAPATPAKPIEQAPAPPPALGIYVTNEMSGDLSIIDAASQSVVGTIP